MSSRHTYVIATVLSLCLHSHLSTVLSVICRCYRPQLPSAALQTLGTLLRGQTLEEKAGDGLRQFPSPPLLHQK